MTIAHTVTHVKIHTTSCLAGQQPNTSTQARYNTGKKLPQAALSGCNQPHEAFNLASIH